MKPKAQKRKNKFHQKQNYVYVLEGKDNCMTYTGVSYNLRQRLKKHNSKSGKRFTRKYQPWRMMAYVQGFKSRRDALSFESATKKQRCANRHKQCDNHRILLNRLYHIIQTADVWMNGRLGPKQPYKLVLVCSFQLPPSTFPTVSRRGVISIRYNV